MKSFRLEHDLQFDITRSVKDISAFFDYTMDENSPNVLRISCTEHNKYLFIYVLLYNTTYEVTNPPLVRKFIDAGDVVDTFPPLPADAPTGEITRRVKLQVLDAFRKFTGEEPELPWGILSGVRPSKLVHKLLDGGVASTDVVKLLRDNYLVPQAQGELLRDIVLRQKQILPDATRFMDAAVYIGIPYCPSRCSYCSFPAGIVPKDEESQQNFLNLIEQDVQNVVQLLSMRSYLSVQSLYIGGGTPTSLNDKVFTRLMNIVTKCFAQFGVREFTVEAGRPDCFTAAKLAAMEQAGVNRISVNPQTFHDATLRRIGRAHTVRDFYRAYAMVRASSIPVVNMDLIVGLPGENERAVMSSIQEALSLEPENLTVHTLTLKRSAPLFGSTLEMPAEAAERCVREVRLMAAGRGLAPYYLYRQHYMLGHLENIGYAKLGTESLYNIQMMEERHPVLGIGPSSASKVPLVDGHHLHKLNLPKNVAVYAASLADINQKRAALFEI